jgi:hypothetical protein
VLPPEAVRKSVVRAMHSFCRKHPEFRVTEARGTKPVYLWEPDDWRSGVWLEASLKSRDPVPFKALKIQWGRALHLPFDPPGEHPHPTWHMPKRELKDLMRAIESVY